MAQIGLGVMLKRLFSRPEVVNEEKDRREAPATSAASVTAGPRLILLVPGVAGVSIYQMRAFEDAHAAAAFVESCNPYRVYKEGIIAYWALHSEPVGSVDSECAVLVRAEPNSDLVHPYAFVDLDTAIAYVRFRVAESCEPFESFVVHWAASVRISANPSGEVRIEPSTPPAIAPAGETHVEPPAEPAAVPPVPQRDAPSILSEPVAAERVSSSAAEPAASPPARTRWSRKPAGSRTPARVKAHALALGLMGYSARGVEQELRSMFPGERVPTQRTVSRWLRRAGISRSHLKRWETMSEEALRVLEKRLAELDSAPLSEVARITAMIERMRRR